jgi:hypothetical protein
MISSGSGSVQNEGNRPRDALFALIIACHKLTEQQARRLQSSDGTVSDQAALLRFWHYVTPFLMTDGRFDSYKSLPLEVKSRAFHLSDQQTFHEVLSVSPRNDNPVSWFSCTGSCRSCSSTVSHDAEAPTSGSK